MQHLSQLTSHLHSRSLFAVNGKIGKTLPDVLYRLLGGMHHVFLVKTITAQFVQKDFVSGEIMRIIKSLANRIHSQKQCRFAQLVFMEAVFQVAQRRNRKDEMLLRMQLDYFRKALERLFNRQENTLKTIGRQFVAVGDRTSTFFI